MSSRRPNRPGKRNGVTEEGDSKQGALPPARRVSAGRSSLKRRTSSAIILEGRNQLDGETTTHNPMVAVSMGVAPEVEHVAKQLQRTRSSRFSADTRSQTGTFNQVIPSISFVFNPRIAVGGTALLSAVALASLTPNHASAALLFPALGIIALWIIVTLRWSVALGTPLLAVFWCKPYGQHWLDVTKTYTLAHTLSLQESIVAGRTHHTTPLFIIACTVYLFVAAVVVLAHDGKDDTAPILDASLAAGPSQYQYVFPYAGAFIVLFIAVVQMAVSNALLLNKESYADASLYWHTVGVTRHLANQGPKSAARAKKLMVELGVAVSGVKALNDAGASKRRQLIAAALCSLVSPVMVVWDSMSIGPAILCLVLLTPIIAWGFFTAFDAWLSIVNLYATCVSYVYNLGTSTLDLVKRDDLVSWWHLRLHTLNVDLPAVYGVIEWSVAGILIIVFFDSGWLLFALFVHGPEAAVTATNFMAVVFGGILSAFLLSLLNGAARIWTLQQSHCELLQDARIRLLSYRNLSESSARRSSSSTSSSTDVLPPSARTSKDEISELVSYIEQRDPYHSLFGLAVKPTFVNLVKGYLVTAVLAAAAKTLQAEAGL